MKSKFQNFSAKTGVLSILKKGIFLFFVMSLLSASVSAQGKQRSEGRKQKIQQ